MRWACVGVQDRSSYNKAVGSWTTEPQFWMAKRLPSEEPGQELEDLGNDIRRNYTCAMPHHSMTGS